MTNFDHGSFIIEKTITSSTLTTSAVNIAQLVGNGVIVEDIVVRTDATGLAGGTNFTLAADGITFFSTAISGLGASAVMDLANASVTGIKALIGAGSKYISVANTVAAGTGAGTITLQITCRKLDSTSTGNAI